MKSVKSFLIILGILIILGVFIYYLTNMNTTNKNAGDVSDNLVINNIVINKPFSLKENETAIFNDTKLTLNIRTSPMSVNQTTGVEQYPVTRYEITTASNKPNVTSPNMATSPSEQILDFIANDSVKDFIVADEPYSLHFITFKNNQAEFELIHVGYKQ